MCNTNQQSNTTTNNLVDEPAIEPCSTPIACTRNELIIQVVGLNHPKGQEVIIEDQDKKRIASTSDAAETSGGELTRKSIIPIQNQDRLSCNLHIWNWLKKGQNSKPLNLALVIDTEAGEKIRLPFATDIGLTPRMDDAELIQVVPIVPFSIVESTSPNNWGVPALARPGYLYIYQDYKENNNRKSKLWREIQIKQDNEGNTTYHDVNVDQHRNSETYKFKDDIRPAVGIPLEEIWLPTSWRPNNTEKNDIHRENDVIYYKNTIGYVLEYSEVQLSAARLNYLADHENHIANPNTNPGTTHYFEMGFSLAHVKNNFGDATDEIKKSIDALLTDSLLVDSSKRDVNNISSLVTKFTSSPFPIKGMPPHRPREEQLEWLLEYPASYLYKEDGNYLSESLEKATNYHNNNFLKGIYDPAQGLEVGAWQTVIVDNIANKYDEQFEKQLQSLQTNNLQNADSQNLQGQPVGMLHGETIPIGETIQDNTSDLEKEYYKDRMADLENQKKEFDNKKAINDKLKEFWNSHPAFTNALQTLQEREIYGCIIEDPHYQVRHLVSRLTECHQTMTYVLEEIPQFEHANSAILVQKIFSPTLVNGEINPYKQEREIRTLLKNGEERIAKHSGSIQRHLLKQHYFNLQFALDGLLRSAKTQKSWADHLSLNDPYTYAAAYLNMAYTFSLLGNPVENIDPFHSENEIINASFISDIGYQSKSAQLHLLDVSLNKENPYHPMLWAEIKVDDPRLAEPYKCPANLPESDGSGKCRLDVVAQLAKYNNIPSDKNITLDTDFLNKIMTQGDAQEPTNDLVKAGLNVLNNIGSTLISNVRTTYIKVRQIQSGYISAAQRMKAENYNAQLKSNTYYDTLNKLLDSGERAQINLYGVKAQLFNIQQFDMMRTFNGNTPLSEAYLSAIQELALQETPPKKSRNPNSSNTIEHIDTSAGQPLTIERNPATGKIVTINGRPVAEVDKRVILFEGNHDQFTGRHVFGNIFNNQGGIINAASNIETGEFSGSTNRARAQGGGLDAARPRNFIAVIYNANTELDNMIKAEYEARNKAIQATKKAIDTENRETLARVKLYWQRHNYLNQFSKNIEAVKDNLINSFLASPHFAGGMLVFASVGLISELNSSSDTEDRLRAFLRLTSSFSDMAFATEELAFRLSRRGSIMVWRMPIAHDIHWRFNKTLITLKLSRFSYLTLFQLGFSLFGVIANCLDLILALPENGNVERKVALSFGLAGSIISTISPLLAPHLVIPVSIFALVLIGIGAFIAYIYEKSPLEQWFKYGPFGDENPQSFNHLKEPVEAYYRLLNLFTNIQITINDNLDDEISRANSVERENIKIIEVTIQIPGLITEVSSLDPIIKCYPAPNFSTTDDYPHDSTFPPQPKILGSTLLENGLRVYVSCNEKYQWKVRAQFKLILDNNLLVFPAPADLSKRSNYDSNNRFHTMPNFSVTGLDYWADDANIKPS